MSRTVRLGILALALIGVALSFDRVIAQAPPAAFDVTVTGAGRGRPLLLIPGLSTPGDVWDTTVARLATSHEVHVLSLAGFGGPASIGSPFLPRVADAIVAYARDRRLAAPVVIGHSLGGFLAFRVASQAPDVFAGVVAVDGVPFMPALANPAAREGDLTAQAATIRQMYAGLSREQFDTQTRLALASMITAPADVDRAVAWTRRTDATSAGIAVAELMTTDARDEAAAITAPVLLIGALGAAPEPMKPAFRDAYRAQVARVPHARVVFAETARHFIMLDDLEFLLSTIEPFLASLPAGEPAIARQRERRP